MSRATFDQVTNICRLVDPALKPWVELDDKIIGCKEYQDMTCATLDQVTLDICSLIDGDTDDDVVVVVDDDDDDDDDDVE